MQQHHFEQLVKGVQEMTAHMARQTLAGIRVTTLNGSTQNNPHQGSSFEDFLKAEGIYDAVHDKALNRALTEQKTEQLQPAKSSA